MPIRESGPTGEGNFLEDQNAGLVYSGIMNLPEFRALFTSEWSSDYVNPLLPRMGDRIRLRLRHPAKLSVDSVWLRTIRDGGDTRLPMSRLKAQGRFTWWEAALEVSEPRIQYSFLVSLAGNYYFVTRRSVTRYAPTEDHDWVVLTDFDFPDWVPESVFYQIFPDRFRKGDPSLGVQTDEYSFGGGRTVAMSWDRPPLDYERGRCLDFFNGDLEGIRQSIPYFRELGVNALYLNPIFEARTTHRYDCTDYFNVDHHLGGNRALARLMKSLHQSRMRAIVDVSINHVGREHVWVRRALADRRNPERGMFYFEGGKIVGWMGNPLLPQLNYKNKLVRKTVYGRQGLVRFWLKKPFRIDGWRFDVGNNTARRGPVQLGNRVFAKVRKAVKKVNPRAYIIGEHWTDNISYHQGDQWDGAMNYFASLRPIRAFLGERDRFIQEDHYQAVWSAPLSGTEAAAMIEQHLCRLPNPLQFLQLNLLGSHDIHRLHHSNPNLADSLYQAAFAFLFCLPGVPCLYYGDEIGIAGGPRSNEECRYPMNWNRETWNLDRLEFFKQLIALRRRSTALQRGAWAFVHTDEATMALLRWHGREAVLMVFNRHQAERELELDLGPYALTEPKIWEPWSERFTFVFEEGKFRFQLSARQSALVLAQVDS